MSSRRGERGQTLVLSALLIVVLIGFVGLTVDGGEAAAEQQLVRNAADGSALAAAYSLNKGSTIAAASTLAGQVLTADALPAGDLAMTYLDSSGAVTAVAANVHTVRAVVTDQHRTYFLGAVGVNSLQLAATAEALAGSSVAAGCALCVMAPGGSGIDTGTGSTMTVTGGPVVANSTAAAAIAVGNNSHLAAPAITIATGGGYTLGSGATISPVPANAAAIADPLAAIPYPSVGGAATAYTAPVGVSSISPGVYSSITVGFGRTVDLNAGTYVVTGAIALSGSLIAAAAGVTIFLACPTYPTACSVGASGGHFDTASGSVLTLSPPAAGTYAGLTVFADRENEAANTFDRSTVSVTGTWYTLSETVADTHTGDTDSFGQMVVETLTMPNSSTLTVTRVGPGSYGGGASSLALSL